MVMTMNLAKALADGFRARMNNKPQHWNLFYSKSIDISLANYKGWKHADNLIPNRRG